MKTIFVFSSNLAGIHGTGAALNALENWGAIYGQGVGLQGASYAIPTKNHRLATLPMGNIQRYVDMFLKYAAFAYLKDPFTVFQLTAVQDYPEGVAPMFTKALTMPNILLSTEFEKVLNSIMPPKKKVLTKDERHHIKTSGLPVKELVKIYPNFYPGHLRAIKNGRA